MAILTANIVILKGLGLMALESSDTLIEGIHRLYCRIVYMMLVLCLYDAFNLYMTSCGFTDFIEIFPATYITVIALLKASIFVTVNQGINEDLQTAEILFKRQKTAEKFVRIFVAAATLVGTAPVVWIFFYPNVKIQGKLLPFHTSLPFNFNDPFQYNLTYAYEMLAGLHVVLVETEIDVLLISISMHCVCYFKKMQHDFADIVDEAATVGSVQREGIRVVWNKIYVIPNVKSFAKMTAFKEMFKDCVKRHQEILKFTSKVDAHFNVIMLTELIGCLLLFGISMLHATKLANNAYLGYLVVGFTKLSLSTFFCEMMAHESMQIAHCLYMSKWELHSCKVQKDIAMVIQRAQRPAVITNYKIKKVGLSNLVWILRATYSYYALLRHQLDT